MYSVQYYVFKFLLPVVNKMLFC